MMLAFVCMLAAAPPVAVAAKPEWLKGRVERVGTVQTPQLDLISEDGKRYQVSGGLVAELTTLEGGAKLEVEIEREHEGSMLPRVRAIDYRIDDVGGGDKPEIGVVKVEGEHVRVVVDKDKTLELADTQVARKLLGKDGAKIWLVGKPTSNGFKAWRVGFLVQPKNPAAPRPTKED